MINEQQRGVPMDIMLTLLYEKAEDDSGIFSPEYVTLHVGADTYTYDFETCFGINDFLPQTETEIEWVVSRSRPPQLNGDSLEDHPKIESLSKVDSITIYFQDYEISFQFLSLSFSVFHEKTNRRINYSVKVKNKDVRVIAKRKPTEKNN